MPPKRHRKRHVSSIGCKQATSIALTCSVCKEVSRPKYKCPKCRATYCSISCCKSHKEICAANVAAVVVNMKQDISSKQQENKSKYVDKVLPIEVVEEKIKRRCMIASSSTAESTENEWRLTLDMISRLQTDDWLRSEVQGDGGLRQILVEIDCAHDREAALLHSKQKYPHFATFIDKMLVCCGILVKDDNMPGGLSVKDDRPTKDLGIQKEHGDSSSSSEAENNSSVISSDDTSDSADDSYTFE